MDNTLTQEEVGFLKGISFCTEHLILLARKEVPAEEHKWLVAHAAFLKQLKDDVIADLVPTRRVSIEEFFKLVTTQVDALKPREVKTPNLVVRIESDERLDGIEPSRLSRAVQYCLDHGMGGIPDDKLRLLIFKLSQATTKVEGK